MIGGLTIREHTRSVWFYRSFHPVTGGYVKHSNYFGHVLRMPGFAPRITFGKEPADESQACEFQRRWPAPGGPDPRWEPGPRDVLFLAGVDWRYLDECDLGSLPNPRINLVQGVRHAHEGTELYGFLSRKAIRICVSQAVVDAVSATGRTNGPVLAIPNGIDVAPVCPADEDVAAAHEARPRSMAIVGYKQPDLARALSRRLDEEGVEHLLLLEFLPRSRYLDLLAESRIAVCLPHEEEGFYLPALEGMALGCIVVTTDCIGSSGYCRHDENCLVAGYDVESLSGATKRALDMAARERGRLLRHARNTAAGYTLDAERVRFHAVLEDVDRLWSTA